MLCHGVELVYAHTLSTQDCLCMGAKYQRNKKKYYDPDSQIYSAVTDLKSFS